MTDELRIRSGEGGSIPPWAQVALTVLLAAVPAAVSYGVVEGRVSALERRADEAEKREREVARAIEAIRDATQRTQVDVARICARVRCQ